jgi:hypothetical protein
MNGMIVLLFANYFASNALSLFMNNKLPIKQDTGMIVSFVTHSSSMGTKSLLKFRFA